MLIVSIAVTIVSAFIVITHLLLILGILRAGFNEKRMDTGSPGSAADSAAESGQALKARNERDEANRLPPVTVIIPARDEEKNLPALFRSLKNQTDQDFEIVLVNDRSQDKSLELMQQFSRERGGVTLVQLPGGPRTGNPKQFALARGIEHASGAILLFTDADCRVPESWIEKIRQCFTDQKTGLVFGPVHTRYNGEHSGEPLGNGFLRRFLVGYQAFDHIFRYFYTVGTAGLGNGTGGFGNNLAIRQKTLEDIGGYESIPYSVTEDAALISAVRSRGIYRIVPLTSRAVKIQAEPKHHLRDLASQEIRWSTGAFFAPDRNTRMGYILVMLYLAAGFFGLIVSPWKPGMLLMTISAIASMSSIGFLGGILAGMPPLRYLLMVVPYVVFSMFFYLFCDLLAALRIDISWKGSTLDRMG
ncbi:MAG: glycosyltransferase [Spirochaetales bacterium]|nr:glycosyltransferase [Spirochaetales bacterium]MCF7937182.1 glycosyltransferase [Spirochaetales bacterium]